jgi:predicted enzyme related to lactoylglutathione lyase
MSHGRIEYLQLPAVDIARSAAFYDSVFGWSTNDGGFEAPGMIGQWADLPVATEGGPLLWIRTDNLYPTLTRVADGGGAVLASPRLDGRERWLTEIEDPAGNRLGIVVRVAAPAAQPLLAVRDVEASSLWYQRLLGLTSDHGGPHYERLLAGGTLVLQLHDQEVEHHHGRIGDPDRELGNGVLLWFGDVADFEDVVVRARDLKAPIVREPHRNPPEGEGNGPGHREIWIADPDGYVVVVASPDGEAYEP